MLVKRKQSFHLIIQHTFVCLLIVWQIKHSSAICANKSNPSTTITTPHTLSSSNRNVLSRTTTVNEMHSPGGDMSQETTQDVSQRRTKNLFSTSKDDDVTRSNNSDGAITRQKCPPYSPTSTYTTNNRESSNQTNFQRLLSNDPGLHNHFVVKRSTTIATDNNSRSIEKVNRNKGKKSDQKIKKIASNRSNSRAVESGRFFFFKGLKKMMWGLFVGLQVVKTVLLALFLPSILGSLGKMVGKGISSVSGYNHPSETVSDLDFRDDTYNLDQEGGYNYQQGEASTTNFVTQMYESGMAYNKNANALSRFGVGDQKLTHVNSMMSNYGPKNTNTDIMSSATATKNNFGDFLDIPASSLLLTNYDPFYSPLLSRLDAVFQQLGLQKENESCRKKLVCFMYNNPAKYAPYSNLVSAQLSRELNELRKPSVDNPDILRFFQYMKAAKDGQDGIDCDVMYSDCTTLKDSENPVMLTTYNDINKLVQARKFQ